MLRTLGQLEKELEEWRAICTEDNCPTLKKRDEELERYKEMMLEIFFNMDCEACSSNFEVMEEFEGG